MASKKRKSISDPNAAAVLTKTKQRSLVDNQLNSIANKAKDANESQQNNVDNNANQGANVAANNINNPNPLSLNLKRELKQAVLTRAQKGQELADEKELMADIQDLDNLLGNNNAANANNVNNDNPVVTDADGNKYRKKELAYLEKQWKDYQEFIKEQDPNGISEDDPYYFAPVKWSNERRKARREYKNMDVSQLAEDYADSLKNNNFLLMSEPHGKSSGFALAARMIAKSGKPGVLMLEAPTAMNLAKDKTKTVGFWGGFAGETTKFGALAKIAKKYNWDIVAVDAIGLKHGKLKNELLKDSGIPGDYSGVKDPNPLGNHGRQYYIARNTHSTMQKYKGQRGGILLIGTKHITGSNVTDLSPMVSTVKTQDVKNKTQLDPVNASDAPFRIVEVDHTKLRPNVSYNGQ